jgi:hypothetical protein
MRATKAIRKLACATWRRVDSRTSDTDRWERPIHPEDASNDDREWDSIGCTHLASKSDDNTAYHEAEEDNGNRLSGGKAE